MRTISLLIVVVVVGVAGTFVLLHFWDPLNRPAAPAPAPAPAQSSNLAEVRGAGKGLRVLFVGNSYTYYHNMPNLVRQLAEAAHEELPLLAVRETPGGRRLEEHWKAGKAVELLAEAKWDYVVLQEQSQLPSFVPERYTEMYPYAQQLDAKIKDAGARTVLYLTWAWKEGDRRSRPADTYAAMQERISQAYLELAAEMGALVAPVGVAWARAHKLKPELDLWDSDGQHPSLKGSYLAACVFYAVLYGKDPTGNTFTAGLDVSEAKFLQEIAASVWTQFRRPPP